MRLGWHPINDQAGGRPLALPENQYSSWSPDRRRRCGRVISTATLPSSGRSGGTPAETAEVLAAANEGKPRVFFPGGEVVRDSANNSGPQSRSLSEAEREALFKRLHLAHMRRIYQEVARQAEKEGWSYADFLSLLLAEEVAGRKQTRLQRLTRSAHFPFLKTIDEFDFSLHSTLRLALLGSYLGPELVSEGRSLILHGKTGRGKTHLAVAIGYRAIQNGFETLFTTAAELIEDLSNASKKGRLQEALTTYTHPHALIIDEVGYLTYAQDAANVLFHVVNNRHLRKRPLIFITNKPLSEWGKVLHDDDLAAAIIDRVLERGRFIRLDGPAGRTRHLKLEDPLPGSTEQLRISGKSGSEFPEPTTCLSRRHQQRCT
jgi:DNA replication protein DnaC